MQAATLNGQLIAYRHRTNGGGPCAMFASSLGSDQSLRDDVTAGLGGGFGTGLMTRIYFPDQDNIGDPVFLLAGDRSNTLVATAIDAGFAHVIHLQGEKETVFFDV